MTRPRKMSKDTDSLESMRKSETAYLNLVRRLSARMGSPGDNTSPTGSLPNSPSVNEGLWSPTTERSSEEEMEYEVNPMIPSTALAPQFSRQWSESSEDGSESASSQIRQSRKTRPVSSRQSSHELRKDFEDLNRELEKLTTRTKERKLHMKTARIEQEKKEREDSSQRSSISPKEENPVEVLKNYRKKNLKKKLKKTLRKDKITTLKDFNMTGNLKIPKTRKKRVFSLREQELEDLGVGDLASRQKNLQDLGMPEVRQRRRNSDGDLTFFKERMEGWDKILEEFNEMSRLNSTDQWAFKMGLVRDFDPVQFRDYKHKHPDKSGTDWLNQKHRILLYPEAAEERFQLRKAANPVPHAFGPSQVQLDPTFKRGKYNWDKGMSKFETTDVSDKKSVYPLRLFYPKQQTKTGHDAVKHEPVNQRPSNWKPAKYNIPDPIKEIQTRGINAPQNLYSGSAVHISTKKVDWMRDLMNSYLVQNAHLKMAPPKDYHSKMKWLNQMEQIWRKHQDRDVSEQNLRTNSLERCAKSLPRQKTQPAPASTDVHAPNTQAAFALGKKGNKGYLMTARSRSRSTRPTTSDRKKKSPIKRPSPNPKKRASLDKPRRSLKEKLKMAFKVRSPKPDPAPPLPSKAASAPATLPSSTLPVTLGTALTPPVLDNDPSITTSNSSVPSPKAPSNPPAKPKNKKKKKKRKKRKSITLRAPDSWMKKKPEPAVEHAL